MTIAILIFGGVLIGLVIGTIGAGSGIVSVPIIHAATGMPQSDVVPHALAIVALSSLASTVAQWRRDAIDVRAAIEFGVSGAVGALLGAKLALESRADVQLWVFAALTTFVGSRFLMTRPRPADPAAPGTDPWTNPAAGGSSATVRSIPVATLAGLLSGLAGGFTGVGGGFVLIPAMVGALRMPMHRAVATTGAVVGINGIVGVAGFAGVTDFRLDVLAIIGGVSIAVAPLGVALSHRLPASTLRRVFGIMVLGIGLHAVWRAISHT